MTPGDKPSYLRVLKKPEYKKDGGVIDDESAAGDSSEGGEMDDEWGANDKLINL